MYLKILNKDNLIDSTLPISTRYNVSNLKQYNIVDGSVYKKNFNETLDSFTAKVSNQNSPINIEPYDEVLINDTISTKSIFGSGKTYKMLVDNYRETMISITPKIYDYEISLFSKTKLLENAICPNLAITPNRVGTKLTLWDYTVGYMNQYCPKKRVGTASSYTFANIISLPGVTSDLHNKLNVDAPELQWNNPTLREVLNTLFMIVDCIPVVNANDELDFLDLTKTENNISNYTNINYIEKSQSADNYVSELYMDMKNVMQTSVNGIKNSINTVERFTFNSSNYVVTDQNFFIKTRYPIQRIKHLYMYNYYYLHHNNYSDSEQLGISKIDLCDVSGNSFVKEYDEYNSLKVCYRVSDLPADLSGKSQTQNCCLYYNRYGTEITGFTTQTKNAPFLIFETGVTNTLYLLRKILKDQNITPNSSYYTPEIYYTANGNNFLFSFFEVEYETTSDAVFRASKQSEQNDRVVIDNQTNSFVDAYTQGNLEYQKANRLGNQVLNINQRVLQNDTTANLIDIGDYYEDTSGKYIVYEVSYQVYESHIEVNAIATKDYILKNYYTGINSKIRTWINAKDEALERHDLMKIYCEFSSTSALNDFDSNVTLLDSEIISPLLNYDISPVKQVLNGTKLLDDSVLPTNNHKYCLETTSRVIGNSIVLSTGYNDNYNVAISPDFELIFPDNDRYVNLEFSAKGDNLTAPTLKNSFLSNYGGTPFQNNKYVDDNGNFKQITFDFRNQDVFYKTNNLGIFHTAIATSKVQTDNTNRYYFNMLFGANDEALEYALLDYPGSVYVYIGGEILHNGDNTTVQYDSAMFKYYFESNVDYRLPMSFTIYPTSTTPDEEIAGETEIKNWFYNSFKKPLCLESEFGNTRFKAVINRRKDNKEIIKQSFQFEYLSKENNIYVNNEFIQFSKFIRENNAEVSIYGSSTYNRGAKTLPQDSQLIQGAFISILNNAITINYAGSYNAYYIVRDSKVIFGTTLTTFYIRKKAIKNDNVYNIGGTLVDKI